MKPKNSLTHIERWQNSLGRSDFATTFERLIDLAVQHSAQELPQERLDNLSAFRRAIQDGVFRRRGIPDSLIMAMAATAAEQAVRCSRDIAPFNDTDKILAGLAFATFVVSAQSPECGYERFFAALGEQLNSENIKERLDHLRAAATFERASRCGSALEAFAWLYALPCGIGQRPFNWDTQGKSPALHTVLQRALDDLRYAAETTFGSGDLKEVDRLDHLRGVLIYLAGPMILDNQTSPDLAWVRELKFVSWCHVLAAAGSPTDKAHRVAKYMEAAVTFSDLRHIAFELGNPVQFNQIRLYDMLKLLSDLIMPTEWTKPSVSATHVQTIGQALEAMGFAKATASLQNIVEMNVQYWRRLVRESIARAAVGDTHDELKANCCSFTDGVKNAAHLRALWYFPITGAQDYAARVSGERGTIIREALDTCSPAERAAFTEKINLFVTGDSVTQAETLTVLQETQALLEIRRAVRQPSKHAYDHARHDLAFGR